MVKSKVRHLFVYGTLMASASDPVGDKERRFMARSARLLGPVAIAGAMFDMGACPAAVLLRGQRRSVGEIRGELWALPPEQTELVALLDRYEGCAQDSPKPHAYSRSKVRIRLDDGRKVTAWVYVWNQPTAGLKPIPDGRWISRQCFDPCLEPDLPTRPPTFGMAPDRKMAA